MKSYYRVMLGRRTRYAEECFRDGFIGTDFDIPEDLSGKLPNEWRSFNKTYIPVYLARHPEKSKVAAGLACGFLWTVSKGVKEGDVVLSPDGSGSYRVGGVTGPYYYRPDGVLPHRRPVDWFSEVVARSDMTKALQNSTGSIGTVSNITGHRAELENLIWGKRAPDLIATDETVEDPTAFALEKHLEDFLVENWSNTELGREYVIFEEDDEPAGQQFMTDTGPMDILAISRDKKRLLVVELKKGRASDAVVGQILRYMGYVREELAENGQAVLGAIIALDDDPRIRRALAMVPEIAFYRYEVRFTLIKS
jgi:restriction system protein